MCTVVLASENGSVPFCVGCCWFFFSISLFLSLFLASSSLQPTRHLPPLPPPAATPPPPTLPPSHLWPNHEAHQVVSGPAVVATRHCSLLPLSSTSPTLLLFASIHQVSLAPHLSSRNLFFFLSLFFYQSNRFLCVYSAFFSCNSSFVIRTDAKRWQCLFVVFTFLTASGCGAHSDFHNHRFSPIRFPPFFVVTQKKSKVTRFYLAMT